MIAVPRRDSAKIPDAQGLWDGLEHMRDYPGWHMVHRPGAGTD